jgi:hypothetical protein
VLESEVVDDGCGFDLDEVRARPGAALHMGLDSMVERVPAAGGEVTIDSEPGAGTCVRFAVPIELSPSPDLVRAQKGGSDSPGSGGHVYCVLLARFGYTRRLPGHER